MKKQSVAGLIAKKKRGEKISVLTAYDYSLARLIDQSAIDIVLVGDSLANVVLGLKSTREVGMTEMIHHAKAVSRAVKESFIVGDMPYDAYQKNPGHAAVNAKKFIAAGCHAVKVEWFDQCLSVTKKILNAGIPVMGHVGLTPQTARKMKVQGQDARAAFKIIQQARQLEKAGCFSIVLECVPGEVAKIITHMLKIPTIGIGAGTDCDGQVLVTYDLLGLFEEYKPKFVKRYTNLGVIIREAVTSYRDEVKNGTFPDSSHSYHITAEELQKLNEMLLR